MPACASQPTAFSLPSAACSPLSSNSSAGGSKHLRYPPASSRGALPVRPERHVPHSIASIRRELTVKPKPRVFWADGLTSLCGRAVVCKEMDDSLGCEPPREIAHGPGDIPDLAVLCR